MAINARVPLAALALLLVANCGGGADPGTAASTPGPAPSGTGTVRLPPADAAADYQLGGAYPPPPGVRVLSRDRQAAPVGGLYNICYVNAFQAQPGEIDWWRAQHPDLLLRDRTGREVVDTDWNETLLDISTAATRTALADIVGAWFDGCADRGFQAIEPDNLDSYQRSHGLLDQSQAVAYVLALAARAHRRGLAVAQKNAGELGRVPRGGGLDFAVVEECGHYQECPDYAAVWGTRLIDIEYDRPSYALACAAIGRTTTVVLRDRDVSPPGSPTYQFGNC
jgi:glycosyl hydrolase family 114